MRRILALVAVVSLLSPTFAGEDGGDAAQSSKPILIAQLGHTRPYTSAVFSPDGRHVLTASRDGAACLWERETEREVLRYEGHSDAVFSASFSADGAHVLTASADGTARLWETATGREVRRYEGHTGWLLSAAFSPDGRRIVTASKDGTARLWDRATGEEVCRFEGHADWVRQATFSPDGHYVVTASSDDTARLWEAETGKELRRYTGHTGNLYSACFSSDGLHVLTAGEDGSARLWETATGREELSYEGHDDWVLSAAFSPDGRHVVTSSKDGTARLWQAEAGREVRRYEGHGSPVRSAVFSSDGRYVLTAGWFDRTARLWVTQTGREVRRYEGRSDVISSVALSTSGHEILTGSWDGSAPVWDVGAGRPVRRYGDLAEPVWSVAFSPDGRHVLTANEDGTARLWERATGLEVCRYEGHTHFVVSARFSRDGRRILTASGDKTARLWGTETGRELRRFEGHTSFIFTAAFSPDERQVLTAGEDGTARRWETETGGELLRYEGHSGPVLWAAFSPDARHVLTAGVDGTARLLETETGREVRRYVGHGSAVRFAEFSPDGRYVLTAGWYDRTARLWDVKTGREVQRYEGHAAGLWVATLSPDSRHVVTAGEDCTTRLWDRETGLELCSLISFRDGNWAVVDPQGRYDASNGGEVEGLHWVVGLETISLAQLKGRYYDPGLLAKHMGLSDEPLREVAAFDAVELFPSVDVTPPGVDDSRLRIALEDRGGGIGRVVVLVNGKEVVADARGGQVGPDQREAKLAIDLAGDPRVRPGETNTVQVFAYNAEGYLRSRGPLVEWEAPGEETGEPPHLWAIVCGVSDYRAQAIDLTFAAKDADDFASALRLAAGGLFGEEQVHVTLLSTTGADGAVRPSRANLEQAFVAARQAGPDDLLVVYLAGHGVSVGGQDGDYHYLLQEAASADLTDPAVRKATSVSSEELTAWINQVPATKRQVLILDTCGAGQLIEDLTETRAVPGSQVRALDRVKDRTGMFVLAGCAADRVSYEASRYGQGLLTYSLLLGMRGGALRDDEYVDVQRLFDFAADQVPTMAQDIGGVQRPLVAQPRGGASFYLGRVPADVRERIPLPAVKPVFVRTVFQEARRMRDSLKLSAALDAALRDAACDDAGVSLLFLDVREMPDAYELTGAYVVDGERVTVKALLWQGEAEVAELAVEGSKDDLQALAAQVVEAARKNLRREGRGPR